MEVSSTRKFNSICVFCGSNLGKNGEFIGAANNLGRTLAERKFHLVYGGGSLGLMGSVAISATKLRKKINMYSICEKLI